MRVGKPRVGVPKVGMPRVGVPRGAAGVGIGTPATPGIATHFSVVAPANVVAGTPFNVVVTARDPFDSVVTTYPGTVHITASDPIAVLPADSTLVAGTKTFSVTLNTTVPAGHYVSATDTVLPGRNGTSDLIVVGLAGTFLTTEDGLTMLTAEDGTTPITIE